MNKQELEQQVEILQKSNDKMLRFVFDLRKFIDTNLQPFRDGIADYEDERNRGILSVLNCLVEKFNQHSRLKIEPLPQYKCEVIKFRVYKGGNDEN